MKGLRRLVKHSRPRFWLYLAGTFATGFAAGAPRGDVFLSFEFFALLFYFLIPANVHLYGVNDVFDTDTDAVNTKKEGREARFTGDKSFIGAVFYMAVLTCFVIVFLPWKPGLMVAVFFALSTMYSAAPIRLKARPFLDSMSNALYIFPGLTGDVMHGEGLDVFLVLGLFAWSAAMHLYSAIPDIDADSSVGVTTTAVYLGETRSYALCGVLWTVFAAAMATVNAWLGLLSLFYVGMVVYTYLSGDIDTVYWYYPFINGLVGFIGFWFCAWRFLPWM